MDLGCEHRSVQAPFLKYSFFTLQPFVLAHNLVFDRKMYIPVKKMAEGQMIASPFVLPSLTCGIHYCFFYVGFAVQGNYNV